RREGSTGKIDSGAEDKRLCASMEEFAELIAKMRREGNAVGSTIRNAWAGKTPRTRARTNPLTATGAPASRIGHITQLELEATLMDVNVFNGFGNRFLWVVGKRSKELPHGGDLRVADLEEVVAKVGKTILWADSHERLIDFNTGARRLWERVY